MAEGAPLLREYGVLSLIKGSNPFVSAKSIGFVDFWQVLLSSYHI